jgi:hypothetical protein
MLKRLVSIATTELQEVDLLDIKKKEKKKKFVSKGN